MMKRKIILFILGILSFSEMTAVENSNMSMMGRVIIKELGAGPAEVIMSADSIVANLTVWENDSLPPQKLSPCMCAIVQYTLCQPVMYKSDKRIYSAFFADVCLHIYYRNTILTLELDYNIDKWRLVDVEGKQLCRYDLKNSELLSLMHELWPMSKNIIIKYDKYANSRGKDGMFKNIINRTSIEEDKQDK